MHLTFMFFGEIVLNGLYCMQMAPFKRMDKYYMTLNAKSKMHCRKLEKGGHICSL